MGILEKKSFRVLIHLATTFVSLILIVMLSGLDVFSKPMGLQFLIFLLIPMSIWYFLFDSEGSGGFTTVVYFIVMGVLGLVIIIALASGISTYLSYDGKINLAQYAALAATPIALAVAMFAFTLIDHHFSDFEWFYPFVPAASCIAGYIIALPICAIGYAASFMLLGGGFIFLGVAVLAYIIYLKITGLPFSGYYKDISFRRSKPYKPSYNTPTAPKPAAPVAPKPTAPTTPAPEATAPKTPAQLKAEEAKKARADFLSHLCMYCEYIDRSCCKEMVKMSATIEAKYDRSEDAIVVDITRCDIDTSDLERAEIPASDAPYLERELKDRVYYFKHDANQKARSIYKTLESKVDAFNSQYPSVGFDITLYTLEL